MTSDPVESPGRNRLLAALPPEVFARLRHRLEEVTLAFKQSVYEPNVPIPHVYFPLDAVFSLILTLETDAVVEIATVGNEGMLGLPVFLGADSSPGAAFCQVPGRALRIAPQALRQETAAEGPLRDLLQRYTQALINQIAQSAACNRVHSIEERLCRWLLMTHDRVGSDRFPLTQEFMGQMLGVRRAGVSAAASILQRAGFIRYSRGTITVVDRAGLESASCGCYRVVRDELDRLLR